MSPPYQVVLLKATRRESAQTSKVVRKQSSRVHRHLRFMIGQGKFSTSLEDGKSGLKRTGHPCRRDNISQIFTRDALTKRCGNFKRCIRKCYRTRSTGYTDREHRDRGNIGSSLKEELNEVNLLQYLAAIDWVINPASSILLGSYQNR